MLIINRKAGEGIWIKDTVSGDKIYLCVKELSAGRVVLGFKGDLRYKVRREELEEYANETNGRL